MYVTLDVFDTLSQAIFPAGVLCVGVDVTPEQIVGVVCVFTGVCLCLFATRALKFFVGLSGFTVTFAASYGVSQTFFSEVRRTFIDMSFVVRRWVCSK